MKKILELRKIGKFYHAFDEDAILLNYLFCYKIVNKKCGFPENVLQKVLRILREKNIHYLVITDEEEKYTEGKNEYQKIFEKANESNQKEEKIAEILEVLKEKSIEELEQIEQKINKEKDKE